MKALFLSVTAGQGHNSAAKAVISNLEDKNVKCQLLDTFEYINPVLSESIARCNSISTKFTPKVYEKLYNMAEKKGKNDNEFSISKITSSILSKKLVRYIKKYKPDIIVCTHVFSAQIVTAMKKKGIKIKSIGIITDFTIHPFWEDTDLDYYITASELLNYQAKKKGIPITKVIPTGIPIGKRFSVKRDVAEARKILGIGDKTTILIMSGGTGHGRLLKLIYKLDKLDMDFQILSVCGKNKKLKKKVDKFEGEKKIYNYGYVDNVDVMMDASDCIITKPGGLSVSESLAKELPIILMKPIPGQEERNSEFLLNNGLAVKISPSFTLGEAIFQIILKNLKYRNNNSLIKNIGKPDSSIILGEFIIDLIIEKNKTEFSYYQTKIDTNKTLKLSNNPWNLVTNKENFLKHIQFNKI